MNLLNLKKYLVKRFEGNEMHSFALVPHQRFVQVKWKSSTSRFFEQINKNCVKLAFTFQVLSALLGEQLV